MTDDHDVTGLSGKDLQDKLSWLVDACEHDGDVTAQKFYVTKRDNAFEIFRVKYNVELSRGFLKFSDGDRPTWKNLRSCLRELSGQHKFLLRRRLGSYNKASFKTTEFKAWIMLLLEIAQSGIGTNEYDRRQETELAVKAALSKHSCHADANDLMVLLASSRDDNDKSKKTRRKAFERLMIRKTSRQMRAVLRQGYFTANSKKRLRQTVSTYKQTQNTYLRDAVNTLMKILYENEVFDLRNKEAFKIILSVFDSITVFDSISE